MFIVRYRICVEKETPARIFISIHSNEAWKRIYKRQKCEFKKNLRYNFKLFPSLASTMVEAIFILCTKDRILFNAPLMYDPHILAVSLQLEKLWQNKGKISTCRNYPRLIFCYCKEKKDGFHFSFCNGPPTRGIKYQASSL